jgi:hypothetical protein
MNVIVALHTMLWLIEDETNRAQATGLLCIEGPLIFSECTFLAGLCYSMSPRSFLRRKRHCFAILITVVMLAAWISAIITGPSTSLRRWVAILRPLFAFTCSPMIYHMALKFFRCLPRILGVFLLLLFGCLVVSVFMNAAFLGLDTTGLFDDFVSSLLTVYAFTSRDNVHEVIDATYGSEERWISVPFVLIFLVFSVFFVAFLMSYVFELMRAEHKAILHERRELELTGLFMSFAILCATTTSKATVGSCRNPGGANRKRVGFESKLHFMQWSELFGILYPKRSSAECRCAVNDRQLCLDVC